jgi:hypothetical protein
VRLAALLAGALSLSACGSDSSAPLPADPGAEAPELEPAGSEASDRGDHVQLSLAGEAAPLEGNARLDVREQNPLVNLTVTAIYASNHDDLVQLQLALDGVANAMGTHTAELGGISARAYAVAYLNRVSYTSELGRLEVTLSSDGAIAGSFDASLSKDRDPAGAQLRLSGSFQGTWSVLCRSPVIGLPGDHSVTDSPYCNSLEF